MLHTQDVFVAFLLITSVVHGVQENVPEPANGNTHLLNSSVLAENHSSTMRLFPRSVLRFNQPVHGSFGDFRLPRGSENKPITFAFIENIVKRTFSEYMHVIETKTDWLEELLKLVREERNIRSRYNCSTDACIYKIQLFMHHLPPHLFTNVQPVHHRRARRSIPDPKPNEDAPVLEKEVKLSIATTDRPIPQVSTSPPIEITEAQDAEHSKRNPPLQDDALRLPDALLVNAANADDKSLVTTNSRQENESKQPPFSNFGDADKINMERVSQKVLSEALSRENKPPITSQNAPVEKDTLSAPSKLLNGVDSDELSLITERSDSGIHIKSHSHDNLPLGNNEAQDTTVQSLEVSESISVKPVDTGMNTDNPSLTEAVVEEDIDVLNTPSVEETILSAVEEVVTPPPVAQLPLEEAVAFPEFIALDLGLPAIPFGLNRFGGNPYEECSGRFENYCYNADKCVYIQVLETAACYCRTGYTGVRCDMYNLPQSLDILKSFTDGETNNDTLKNVVEATARYTVNAALAEACERLAKEAHAKSQRSSDPSDDLPVELIDFCRYAP